MHDFNRAVRVLTMLLHWCAAAFMALISLLSALNAILFHEKGLNTAAYVIAIAVMVVALILISPPIFSRLSGRVKKAAYAFVPLSFAALIWTFTIVNEAYVRTPEGALEAKVSAELDARQLEIAKQEKDRQATSAIIEEYERYVATAHRQIQGCINWQGQVPALVRRVKDAAHNPRSFEHVQTKVRTVGDMPAVVMEYRAENAFGAIRKEAVSAFISTDDCSVLGVDRYDPSNFRSE